MSAAEPPPSGAGEWVVAFVRGRDAPCPRCGYNLRDLSEPVCPECAEPLELRVGLVTPRFGYLVAAMGPGIFSGVCAVLLAAPLWINRHAGPKGPPTGLYIAEVFGIFSALAAVALYHRRRVFMRWSRGRQAWAAAGVWGLHVAALALLVWSLTR